MSWNLARNLGYDKSKSPSTQQYNVYLFMQFSTALADDKKKKKKRHLGLTLNRKSFI